MSIFYLLHCIVSESLNTVFWRMDHCSVLNTHEMVGNSCYLVACCLLVPAYLYPDGPYHYRSSYDGCVWDTFLDTGWICVAPILVPHKNQKLLVSCCVSDCSSRTIWVEHLSYHCHLTCARGNTAHYLLHGCHHKHPMDGLRLVFPPAAAAILCFPVNEIPNILHIWATMDVYDLLAPKRWNKFLHLL